jgi:flagellar hook-basal body complex protein FliE
MQKLEKLKKQLTADRAKLTRDFNKTLRQMIKDAIKPLSDGNKDLFKRMYGKLDMDINEVIDKMNSDKLEWGYTQVIQQHRRNLREL